MLNLANNQFLPNLQVLLADNDSNQNFLAQHVETIATVESLDGKATAYLCEDFICRAPTNDVSTLSDLLMAGST